MHYTRETKKFEAPESNSKFNPNLHHRTLRRHHHILRHHHHNPHRRTLHHPESMNTRRSKTESMNTRYTCEKP